MARPKTFNEDEVLDRAVELFLSKGFERASMPELTAHLGICRQSLYNSFGDKRGLYLAALDLYGTREIDAKLAAIKAAPSPLQGVQSFIASWQSAAATCPSGGCLLVTALVSAPEDDEPARTLIEGHVDRLERGIKSALKDAQSSGELTKDSSTPRLARSLITTFYGIALLAQLPSSSARIKAAVTEAQAHLAAHAT
jgi:TetR/AcrR family transcriptional repressor of nem operon